MQIEDKYCNCLMLHSVISVNMIECLLEFSESLPFAQVKYERKNWLYSLKEEKTNAIRFNHPLFFFLKPLD